MHGRRKRAVPAWRGRADQARLGSGLETGARPHDLMIRQELQAGIGQKPVTNFWNMAGPMLLLGGVAALIPNLLVRKSNLSQQALTRAVLVSALLTLAVGAVISAVLYARINEGVLTQFLAAPLERAGFFLGRSALFALFWAPVLGFVWLVKAQELNRRAGLRMVDEGGRG